MFCLENREFSFALESSYTHLGLCGETGESEGVIATARSKHELLPQR